MIVCVSRVGCVRMLDLIICITIKKSFEFFVGLSIFTFCISLHHVGSVTPWFPGMYKASYV